MLNQKNTLKFIEPEHVKCYWTRRTRQMLLNRKNTSNFVEPEEHVKFVEPEEHVKYYWTRRTRRMLLNQKITLNAIEPEEQVVFDLSHFLLFITLFHVKLDPSSHSCFRFLFHVLNCIIETVRNLSFTLGIVVIVWLTKFPFLRGRPTLLNGASAIEICYSHYCKSEKMASSIA